MGSRACRSGPISFDVSIERSRRTRLLRRPISLWFDLETAHMTAAKQAKPDAGPWGSGKKMAGTYAQVNGISLYYEIIGSGKPLVLLHGGLGAFDMMAPLLPALAKGRQIIGVDLQGHGRTADI